MKTQRSKNVYRSTWWSWNGKCWQRVLPLKKNSLCKYSTTFESTFCLQCRLLYGTLRPWLSINLRIKSNLVPSDCSSSCIALGKCRRKSCPSESWWRNPTDRSICIQRAEDNLSLANADLLHLAKQCFVENAHASLWSEDAIWSIVVFSIPPPSATP